MNEIDKYIDFIFEEIINSKATKKLKEQMKTGAKEKYEVLTSEGFCEIDAVKKVISELGTSKDLKAEYPVRNRILNIVAYVFFFLMILSVGYTVYVFINWRYFELYFIEMPLYYSFYILNPFNFLSITYLIIWFLNKLWLNREHLTLRKEIRIPILVISIGMIAFYYFGILVLNFGFITIPSILFYATRLLEKASYVFAPIGVLLFLGLKS
jgi:hypothetical protein